MITTFFQTEADFELLVSGKKTCLIDYTDEEYMEGDIVGVREKNLSGFTGRYCVFMVSHVEDIPDAATVLSVQPCRVEEHRRLTAEVYGKKEDGSDEQ